MRKVVHDADVPLLNMDRTDADLAGYKVEATPEYRDRVGDYYTSSYRDQPGAW